MKKRRFAIVGASGRGYEMYAKSIADEFSRTAELVALCDPCQHHMDWINARMPAPVPTFKDFDRMLREVETDSVIVTTMDSTHHQYIVAALKAGKDVISEKPMTIDDKQTRAVLHVERETGRNVTVTFNCRFGPPYVAIRRILAEGAIGKVVTVDMHWALDLRHGANYFRRWHRMRANTGGLQVHKSTHHLDLVNWWIQDEPVAVTAQGGLDFYGSNGPFRSKRCLGCPHKDECRFYWDITSDENQFSREFHYGAESETGYLRDGCVFDEEIDIEDNYSLMVKYRHGARLAYSLQAFATWEGFQLAIQGKKGRLQFGEEQNTHDWSYRGDCSIIVTLNDGTRIVHTPPKVSGGHGGSDTTLGPKLFTPGPHDDPLGQMAGTIDAAHSVLIGVAATKSMQNNGRWIQIADLLKED